MAKTRVIILAAGSGERWKDFRGTPKHLTKIEGKVLLERTCSQFLKYTDDVCVIGLDERYKVEGTSLYTIQSQNTHWRDAAKFLSSKNLWLNDGRTVLVFGDVYFTSEAVKTIMKDKDPFKFFLRTGPSELSGARWKEIFGLSFDQNMARTIGQNLLYLVSMGQIQSQAGWALYRYMIGPAPSGMFENSHFVEINDWTEDFDFPEDLEIWEEHRKKSRAKKSS
jgi:hypothetical protein